MGVWNGGMRRWKTIILTVFSFTSERAKSCSQYLMVNIGMDDTSACAWRLDTANLQADSRVTWLART